MGDSAQITGVYLVVDESINAGLSGLGRQELGAYAITMARPLAEADWPAIEAWMQRSGQTISIAKMGGPWDAGRLGEVVQNMFGQTSPLKAARRLAACSGYVPAGNLGLVIALAE